MTLNTWLAFLVAALLICLSPGPGALSCVSSGLRHGFRTALWNVAGLQAGAITLLIVVAIGLGATLAASPRAFAAVKWAGALYLVWLGVQQFRSAVAPIRAPDEDATLPPGSAARALFLRGFLVNASNPKGILFMLSVLPQFIDPEAPLAPQYLTVSATLSVIDVCCMGSYTALGVQALRLLRDARVIRWTNRGFGTLFVVAGLALALFDRQG